MNDNDEFEFIDHFDNLSNRRNNNKNIKNKGFVCYKIDIKRQQSNNKYKSYNSKITKPEKYNDYLINHVEEINRMYNTRNSNSNKNLFKTINNEDEEELNLKEFIESKIKKNFRIPVIKGIGGHCRSNSTNLYKY